jgi:hypothetical protein
MEGNLPKTPVSSFLEGKETQTGSLAHYITAVRDLTTATFNPHALGDPGAVNSDWMLNHTDEVRIRKYD